MNGRARSDLKPQTSVWLDLDGVVLDSNETKAACFASVVRGVLGRDVDGIEAFALQGRGIPRREKFQRACREVAGAVVSDDELDAMCATYADLLAAKIPVCPLIPGVLDLLNTEHRFGLCTSAPEEEARGILASRGIDRYFATIAGYPQSKVSILRRAAASRPVIYFGDGAADAEAAALADVPFVFVGHAVVGEGPRVDSFLPTDDVLEIISAVAR